MEYLGDEDEGLPSEIVAGRLFLGAHWHGRKAGVKGSPLQATHVLNVSDFLVLQPGRAASGAVSAWVPIADDGSDDVFGPGGAWWRCRLFLRDALGRADSRVLVHCALGVNRSATIVAAWLMESHRWTAREALHYLEERRPVVSPVSGHLKQLDAFQQLLGIPDSRCAEPRATWDVRRLQLRAAACLLACLACWFMAVHRPHLHGPWQPKSCRVLAAGVDSVGGCGVDVVAGPSPAAAALPAAASGGACGAAALGRAGRPPPAGGDCSTAYLPWVLVAVAGSEATEEVHCAYQHGLPALSLVDSPTGAASTLVGVTPGQLRQCLVAGGEQGRRREVALAPGRGEAEGRARAEWQKANLRYRHSWFIVGLGFLTLGLPAVLRLRARGGGGRDERARPLLAC